MANQFNIGDVPGSFRQSTVSTLTNATTTMANVTELSVDVVNGRVYWFEVDLFLSNSVAADGVKLDFAGGTGLVFTGWVAHGLIYDTALLSSARTAINTGDFSAAVITGNGYVKVVGAFLCTQTGTFIPRVAKLTNTTGTLTLTVGSTIEIGPLLIG